MRISDWSSDVCSSDLLVFDLDPGEGVDWNAIKAAAREIRARLQEAGLESFLRLSGGKGLHVVVPIAPHNDWHTAQGVCEAFARALENDRKSVVEGKRVSVRVDTGGRGNINKKT